jgi:hypothetical protein
MEPPKDSTEALIMEYHEPKSRDQPASLPMYMQTIFLNTMKMNFSSVMVTGAIDQ